MLPRTLEPEVMDTAEEANDYDQMDHSVVNQLFVDDFLAALREVAELQSQGRELRIVDLGTGTAQIPIRLLQKWPQCGQVSACDLSLEMLRLADRNISAAGYQGRIHPLYCDAKRLPFNSGSVHVLISNSIIHHIPSPASVFFEVARCLSPAGLLFFRDLLRPHSAEEVDHLVDTYAGSENAHSKKMFRESLHAALTVAEVKELLQDAGFDGDSVRQTSDRHWTACCQKVE
jgi:ubiquinone/menaquinone biosynthesis C-methylase UbiE